MIRPESPTYAAHESELQTRFRLDRVEEVPETGTFRVTCRPDEHVPTVVALTVAVARNVGAMDLPSLSHEVDPDALSRLIRGSPGADVSVQFRYADCTVTVRPTGVVTVAVAPDAAADPCE